MQIGILGGGQLARMLILAGTPLGITFRVYSDRKDEATQGLVETFHGSYEDTAALAQFAQGLDLITYEFENLSAHGVTFLEGKLPVFPSAAALSIGQDRAQEKSLFNELQIPTTTFQIVATQSELKDVLTAVKEPRVVKTTRLGYDGRGQFVFRTSEDLNLIATLGAGPYLVENLVQFDREVSILGARSRSGEIKTYPLVENLHVKGILRRSIAPAPHTTKALEVLAQSYLEKVLVRLNYCGMLAIEFFELGGSLVANEMAPRVHNTGHWTIEGSVTSQFENHIRAVTGLPLGDTVCNGISIMINLIGEVPSTEPILKTSDAHLHLYGKTPRPGRKLGHITFRGQESAAILQKIETLLPSAT